MNDVLALVRDCETWQPHVGYAVDLAAKLHGSLCGIHVTPRSMPIAGSVPPALANELAEFCREESARARHANVRFSRWAAEHGVVHSTWHVATGDPAEVLEAAANWHDLLVLEARPHPMAESLEVGSTLIRAGLPCVIVPPGVEKANLGTIAIAWNGSAQAARAVHAALPLLHLARQILVIRAKGGDSQGRNARDEIDDYFAQHGLRHECVDVDSNEDDAGAAILQETAKLGADMLVLGAYGRARFSEWFFGGVTRHVLEHATLPLFMRH